MKKMSLKKSIELMKYNGFGVSFGIFVFISVMIILMSAYSGALAAQGRIIWDSFCPAVMYMMMLNFGFSLWQPNRLTAGSEISRTVFCSKIPLFTGISAVSSLAAAVIPSAVRSIAEGADCTESALSEFVFISMIMFLYCIAEGMLGMKKIRAFLPVIFYIVMIITDAGIIGDPFLSFFSLRLKNIYFNSFLTVMFSAAGPFAVSLLRKIYYSRYIRSGFVMRNSWDISKTC